MTLAPAYGSCPGHPPAYVMYISRHGDDDTQSMVVSYASPYAARKFLDALLESDGYIWEDDCTIRSETGVVVSTRWYPDRMLAVIEHEYSIPEMGFSLMASEIALARRFRYGPEMPRTLAEVSERAPRPARAPSAPRASRDGLVPISDVALALGVEPRQCRAALRAMSYPKPAAGWAFPKDEVEAIKARIKEHL